MIHEPAEFVGAEFDAFAAEFRQRWRPGEHVAFIGPTGVGKSTLAGHLLPMRRYVLALDPKGGDTTLSTLEKRGFQRITSWPPPRKVREAISKGEPARLIVGQRLRARADRPKLRALLSDAIDGAFEEGGWTLYVDELQVAADRRLMNLTAGIEENLIAARDRGVSVVTSYQRPANVPRTASEMSTYLFVWYTRDQDTVDRIAQMMGRPKAEIRGAIGALGRHDVAMVTNNPHDPLFLTHVPKL